MGSKFPEWVRRVAGVVPLPPSGDVWEPRWWMSLSLGVLTILQTTGWAGLKQVLVDKMYRLQGRANDYQAWIRRFDALTGTGRVELENRVQGLITRPVIAVVMVVDNPRPQFLSATIQSIRRQIYPDWELCVVVEVSSSLAVRQVIERHRGEDERIKVIFRQEGDPDLPAENLALELTEDEFAAQLGPEDMLAEHALFWVADAIDRCPGLGLCYSDEDRIDDSGRRYGPYFKCEYNYELLLAQNMVSRFSVYRSQLLRDIGGFRPGFEAAQDWDVALRASERLAPDQIVHIPRVLYHWRGSPGGTAPAADDERSRAEAGRRALAEHLERRGIAAEVLPAPELPACNRVRFARPDPLPLVSILIPTRDCADLLSTCIGSILTRSSYPNYEIIIIDNGSEEPATFQLLDYLPRDRVCVVRDESPFNFSRLNNLGARRARGELLCLMNNDIEVLTRDWLEELASFGVRPGVGAVGARLWHPDGLLQHGGVITGVPDVANHWHYNLSRGNGGYFGRAVLHQSFSALTAACLLVRRSVFEAVGGLDEALAVAYNDVDFCLRIREAGYRNVWTPYAEMNHHESASRGYLDNFAKRARFVREVRLMQKRWGARLLQDPAYSPNLTLDLGLAWPPRLRRLPADRSRAGLLQPG